MWFCSLCCAHESSKIVLSPPAPPTLTLWVGLASGHVAAYGIVVRQPGTAQAEREVNLIPTRTSTDVRGVVTRMQPCVFCCCT